LSVQETPPDPQALDHVRAITEAAQSSFFWAIRFMPRKRREGMFAVYAFCREVDDIADGDDSAAEKMAKLAEWRRQIDLIYTGRPTLPTARALVAPTREFALAREDFLAMIAGMEMDAQEAMRAPTLAELEIYCDRVAGAAGLLSIKVFGADSPRAPAFAIALGRALQTTNILRDLDEDAAMGRVYLPREILRKHGIMSSDPESILAHPALSAACAEFAEFAAARFADAQRELAHCPGRALRPAVVMMVIYRRLLDRMRRNGWRAHRGAVSLSKPEKLWIAFRHGIL
jgi:phytoene synthase